MCAPYTNPLLLHYKTEIMHPISIGTIIASFYLWQNHKKARHRLHDTHVGLRDKIYPSTSNRDGRGQIAGSVIAADSVPEMLKKARKNLEIAAEQNPCFDSSFVSRSHLIQRHNAQRRALCLYWTHSILYRWWKCFDDGNGHIVIPNVPLAVCDKTARWFE